jgi:hypothetical protein
MCTLFGFKGSGFAAIEAASWKPSSALMDAMERVERFAAVAAMFARHWPA